MTNKKRYTAFRYKTCAALIKRERHVPLPSWNHEDFLQRTPEGRRDLGLPVWDHFHAHVCPQLDAGPPLPDGLQAFLADVPAEVHPHLLQAAPVRRRAPQAAVRDANAVLQVEAPQLPAAAQNGDDVLVRDVAAPGQAEREQVGTPVDGMKRRGVKQRENAGASVSFPRLASGRVVICMRGVCGIRLFGEGLALSKQHLTGMCASVHFFSPETQGSSGVAGQRREV